MIFVDIIRQGVKNIHTVSVTPVQSNIYTSVKDVFNAHGGLNFLLKGKTEAVIKINAVNSHPYTYTDPSVLKAAILNLYEAGVKKVYVVENCTQGNFTRLVFNATEIGNVCHQNGAKPVFLDEGLTCTQKLPQIGEKARFNRWLSSRLGNKRQQRNVFFLNIPKLKTHSMSVVTLGIKNLLGLMDQRDRMHGHNYKLHEILASLHELFPPDFTLIDGLHAVYHGHYPPAKLLPRCTEKLDILVGGSNTPAVDTVGAKILGYNLEEVEHLRLAASSIKLEDIKVKGDMSKYNKKYPYTLIPEFPADVNIYQGYERCCPEGCYSNTLSLLQLLHLDHNGKGGFNILMGKGFPPEMLSEIRPPALIAGQCAINEAAPKLYSKFGSSQIWETPACNDLATTIKSLASLMDVNMMELVPLNPIQSFSLLAKAKLKGSKARINL